MHNLVKEASGIDFSVFDDVKAAKEVTLTRLESILGDKDIYAINSSTSVGNVLNEVSLITLL